MSARAALVLLALGLAACVLLPAPRAHAQPAEAAWDTLAGPIDPTPSYAPLVFRDTRRQRMVVLDGTKPAILWSYALDGPLAGRWDMARIAGRVPLTEYGYTAVYDSSRNRVVRFGGGYAAPTNEVWALALDDPPHWEQLSPAGTPPPPGSGYGAIEDVAHDRMIILDGTLHTWALAFGTAGGPSWQALDAVGDRPPPRGGACPAYDPWNDRMVVFGGYADAPDRPCYGNHYDETWALSLGTSPTWKRLVVAYPPPARMEAAVVVDPATGRMLLSGGHPDNCTPERTFGDTWALDLRGAPRWTLLTPAPGPAATGMGMILVPASHSLLRYFGTWDGLYELSLATPAAGWVQRTPPAPDPYPVRRPDAVVLEGATPDQWLVWGGICRHDLWQFTRGAATPWTALPSVGSSRNCGAKSLVYDPRRNRMLAFTPLIPFLDQDAPGFVVDAMSMDPPRAWAPLPVAGPQPPPNLWFSVVYDPLKDRVLLFGGSRFYAISDDCGQSDDDVWELTFGDSCRWHELHPVNSPGARDMHEAVFDAAHDRMIVFAGEYETPATYCGGGRPLSDTWSLALAGDSLRWTRLDPVAPFDPAARLVLDAWRERLVALSGDMAPWALPLDGSAPWRPLRVAGDGPGPHASPGVLFQRDRDALVAFGGSSNADLYALRFLTPVTRGVALTPAGSGNAAVDRPRALGAAVLGSASLAVDSILVASIRLAGAPASGRPPVSRRDVNGDGLLDLVFAVDRATMTSGDGDRALAFLAQAVHGTRLVGTLALRGNVRDPGASLHTDVAADGLPETLPAGLRVLGPVRAGDALAIAYRLRTPAGAETRAQVSVYDVAGRRVATRELDAGAPGATITLDEMRGRGPGVYFVRLVQGGWCARARAIVLP